jgi:hypothetical protein
MVVPPKDLRNLTDAEKIARYEQWKGVIANAGTYEIKGSTLTMRTVVSKNLNAMIRARTDTWDFKLEGSDVLWLIPPPERKSEPRIKLTRLE